MGEFRNNSTIRYSIVNDWFRQTQTHLINYYLSYDYVQLSACNRKSVKPQCCNVKREKVKKGDEGACTNRTSFSLDTLTKREREREPVGSRRFEAICCIFHER